MLDHIIVKFAKENGFKATKNAVFGLYRGQLFTIATNAQGAYTIVCTTKISLNSYKKKFASSQTLKKYKLHRNFYFYKDKAIGWFTPMMFKRNKEERLLNLLNAISDVLTPYQNFQPNGDIVLYEGVARFRIDLDKERNTLPLLQTEQDWFGGTIASFVAVAITGVVLGAIQFIMTTKANTSWNPMFIGFITANFGFLAYRKFAGHIDYICKVLIIPLSGIGHLISFVVTQYFYLETMGFETSYQMILDQLNITLSNKPLYHALSLFYGTFLVAVLKVGNLNSQRLEEGEEITTETYKSLEAHRLGDKLSTTFFIFAMIYFSASLIIAITSDQGFERISSLRMIALYAFIMHIGLVGLIYYLSSVHEPTRLTFSHIGMTKIGATGKLLTINIFALLISMGNFGTLTMFNSKMDGSTPRKYQTTLTNGRVVGNHNHRNFCYNIKHWDSEEAFTDLSFCKKDYGHLQKDEPIQIKVKKGALGVPWLFEFELPRYKTFETFLTSLDTEKDLRFLESQYFYQNPQKSTEEMFFISHKNNEWEKLCNANRDYTCRLRSYFSAHLKENAKRIRYLDMGCSGGDITACYGLHLELEGNEAQKSKYVTLLQKKCQRDEWNHCLTLGDTLWRLDYHKNYDTLLKLYKRICNEGKKETACESLKQLNKYRVKRTK